MPKIKKHELGQTLMLVLQDFQHRLDADLADSGFPGIQQRHRAVFMHLSRYGASRSVDLAAAASIRPQSMMTIVHELESLGLVERRPDPADSRAKLVGFTEDGEKKLEQLTASTEVVWSQYAELLGKEDLDNVLDSLRSLIDVTQEEDKT